MTTRPVPRLELWTGLGCDSGQRLSTGGFVSAWTKAAFTKSEDNEESLSYTIPLYGPDGERVEASDVVREGHVSRLWYSDTVYDEWPVRTVAKRKDKGGRVDVTCGPVSYYLAERNRYVEDIVTPSRGKPLLEAGVVKQTLADLFTNYLVDNASVNTRLPWLAVGSIASPFDTVEIDLSWSFATPQAFINAAVTAAETQAGQPAVWRLVRNGSTSYDITVYLAT